MSYQVLIPMAGDGRRFQVAGHDLPKPLIPVDGVPMIVRALDGFGDAARVVFVSRREHQQRWGIFDKLRQHVPDCRIVEVEGLTEGQACTVRLGVDELLPGVPVIIGACDNSHRFAASLLQDSLRQTEQACFVWTFRHDDRVLAAPHRYGWVVTEGARGVRRVSCKVPISAAPRADHAVTGCFTFRDSAVLREGIDSLIAKEQRVNGEYYMDSVPNVLIEQGHQAGIFEVEEYYGWGTPEELQAYVDARRRQCFQSTEQRVLNMENQFDMSSLRREVCHANRMLAETGLAPATSGNASGLNRELGRLVIKPSGIDYAELTPDDLVEIDFPSGEILSLGARPSVDLPHHLYLYQHLPDVGAIIHTHSSYATAFATLERPIPACLTEIADVFGGPIPCAPYASNEVDDIGRSIVEHRGAGPAILLGKHGVVTWGRTPKDALKAAVMVEHAAKTVWLASALGQPEPLSDDVVRLWHRRYTHAYGQLDGHEAVVR